MLGDKNFRVVVAIDFGTSRSGYAYAFKDDKRVISKTEWPDQIVPFAKTLTQILYTPDRRVKAWGYSARQQLAQLRQSREAKNYPFFKNFKMELVYGKQTSNGPIINNSNHHFFAVDVISDYLREMKNLALREIKDNAANLINEREILWCLTIPAIWTDANKQLMRQAAIKAGIIGSEEAEAERLRLILEPEAAAVYVQEKTDHQLTSGSSYMIVDCGGGTVDITVHRLTKSNDGKPSLGELVPGTGGPFGSTEVDKEFAKYLRRVLSIEAVDSFEREKPVDYLHELMTTWEQIKVSYDPTKNEEFQYFPISSRFYNILRENYPDILQRLAQEQQGIDDTIHISKSDMEAIFQPALDGLVQTVREQYRRLGNEKCDYIFLVGGFSSSILLKKRIRQEFGQQVKDILIPPYPGAAIVEGAVTLGWNPEILPYRCSRLTYGCRSLQPFIEGTDPENKRKWYPDLNDYRCDDRFSIFVQAGQKIGSEQTVKKTFSPVSKDQTSIIFQFYATKKKAVSYTDEPEVEDIGEMIVEMPDTTGGINRSVEVTMQFGKTEIKVDGRDLTSGKRAQTTLRFSYTYSSELIGDF